jgi:hypothetical protein
MDIRFGVRSGPPRQGSLSKERVINPHLSNYHCQRARKHPNIVCTWIASATPKSKQVAEQKLATVLIVPWSGLSSGRSEGEPMHAVSKL